MKTQASVKGEGKQESGASPLLIKSSWPELLLKFNFF